MRKFIVIVALLFVVGHLAAQPSRVEVTSPDGANAIALDWSDGALRWSARHNGVEAVALSRMAMATDRGVWGENVGCVESVKIEPDSCVAEVTFGEYGVELRAYDEGVAYRFISHCTGDYKILDELAEFAFDGEDMAYVPYVNFRPDATSDYATQYETSFENIYSYTAIKNIDWRRLIFAPVVVEGNGLKFWLSEANLEDYPGMFFSNRDGDGLLDTEFAPRPKEVEQGGHNMLQGMVLSRYEYIAECRGERHFPWRIVAIGESDADIANSNLVWELSDECRVADTSWIKPGKVAWEWWNDWGLEGVDFEVGINNATYKYYIDFASRYGIEYVILDEGWAVNLAADLMQVIPEIDIQELVDYAAERNVGIILWAGYWALNRDIEGLCKHYSEMGVKGWKVDFLDRDDQEMVEFVYDLAEVAAKYKLLVDYHGVYKPAGLNKTYPNAINFEGVHGLETMKWLGAEHDQITYDVSLPFIRGVAGPMDYTQGAMLNAAKGCYEPNYSRPMSQGTRCHQLAMYVVYDAPLTMLCDSPTNYEKEPEFTAFLASIPTVWSDKKCLEGAIGEYVVVTTRTDDALYVAGLNGSLSRDVVVDYRVEGYAGDVEIYCDAATSEVRGSDYTYTKLSSEDFYASAECRTLHMASGGGFLIKISKN